MNAADRMLRPLFLRRTMACRRRILLAIHAGRAAAGWGLEALEFRPLSVGCDRVSCFAVAGGIPCVRQTVDER